MKNPAALLGRILLGALVSAILTVAPAYAQHGGGGGMGGHGSGGGSHGGGGMHGGGGAHGGAPAGGGHSGPASGVPGGGTGGMHATGVPMPGPVMRSGTASHFASSSPNWGRNVFVPPNTSAAERVAPLPLGSMHGGPAPFVWQEPPASAYPNRVTVSPTRWASSRPGSAMIVHGGTPVASAPAARMMRGVSMTTTPMGAHGGTPVASAPAARMMRGVSMTTTPMGAHVGSQVFAESVRQPRAFFFPHRRFRDDDFFFVFGFGHHRFHSFGVFPFQQCFFNGFTSVCAFQPAFFSLCGFGPFGFGDVGWGWNYGYQAAAQPVEEQPAETSPPNDYLTYQPGTAPEPRPPEQANASPLILLVLKDGSVYGVTDYWLEEGRLHYLTSYGGANDISIEQLDLQKTVDQNWARGVEFALRPAH